MVAEPGLRRWSREASDSICQNALFRALVDRFNQCRTFFLEALVAIILPIEFFFLFRGRPF